MCIAARVILVSADEMAPTVAACQPGRGGGISLWVPLLLSCLLHILVLAAEIPLPSLPLNVARGVQVSFRSQVGSLAPDSSPEHRTPARVDPPRKIRAERARVLSVPAGHPVRTVSVVRDAHPVLPQPSPSISETSGAGGAGRQAEEGSVSGASVQAPAASPSPVPLAGLPHYRLALAKAARGYRRYPALARERGWEGTVEIVVRLSRTGQAQVSLYKGSQHELLDVQGLAMLEHAARVTSVPGELLGQEASFVLPVEFSLKE